MCSHTACMVRCATELKPKRMNSKCIANARTTIRDRDAKLIQVGWEGEVHKLYQSLAFMFWIWDSVRTTTQLAMRPAMCPEWYVCLNGGTCVLDLSRGPQCMCTHEFEGLNCGKCARRPFLLFCSSRISISPVSSQNMPEFDRLQARMCLRLETQVWVHGVRVQVPERIQLFQWVEKCRRVDPVDVQQKLRLRIRKRPESVFQMWMPQKCIVVTRSRKFDSERVGFGARETRAMQCKCQAKPISLIFNWAAELGPKRLLNCSYSRPVAHMMRNAIMWSYSRRSVDATRTSARQKTRVSGKYVFLDCLMVYEVEMRVSS